MFEKGQLVESGQLERHFIFLRLLKWIWGDIPKTATTQKKSLSAIYIWGMAIPPATPEDQKWMTAQIAIITYF